MTDEEVTEGYEAYRVSGVPAGYFGESYVITTWTLNKNGVHFAEYFFISKRHDPKLDHLSLTIDPGGIPDHLLKVDKDYLLSEAQQQAQLFLDEALYKLADAHGDQVLDRYQPTLVKISSMPLLRLWVRGELKDEVCAIAQETDNPSLKQLLEIVTKN